jgi:hypothetical protein
MGTSDRLLVTSLTCHLHSTANSVPRRIETWTIRSCFDYEDYAVPGTDNETDDGAFLSTASRVVSVS